jgi:citronellyl-CoA dehydrogenase
MEINPHVEAWEEAGTFPAHALFASLGRLGLLGIDKPTDYGGLGLDFSYMAAFTEEMGRRCTCGGVPMAVSVHTSMCTPALARHGSDDLRREFLAPSIAGAMVGCIGVTEPGAGSDVAAIRTTARSDGDDYIINGSKTYITNGVQADWMCCLLNISDGPPHRNKSLVIVPMRTKGVNISRKLRKLGMWSSDTAEIFFDDVRVPKRHRIGAEGEGFKVQMEQFQEERLVACITQLGRIDLALELTVAYAREREVFGAPVIANQVVQFRLAELVTEVEMLRSLVWRAVDDYVAGRNITRLASMAKLRAGRISREVTDGCMQFFGGMGYMWETPIARLWRDCRLLSIGGGADEVMLRLIAQIEGFSGSEQSRQ